MNLRDEIDRINALYREINGLQRAALDECLAIPLAPEEIPAFLLKEVCAYCGEGKEPSDMATRAGAPSPQCKVCADAPGDEDLLLGRDPYGPLDGVEP